MSPVILHGRLYVGDTEGIFYVVDARSGAVIDTQMFGAPFTTSPPVVVGATLYVINGTSLMALPIESIRHKPKPSRAS